MRPLVSGVETGAADASPRGTTRPNEPGGRPTGRDGTDEAAAWRRARRVAAVVFLAALVPGRRHHPPHRPPVHVDKLAHAVGHAALAAALFDALRYRRVRWRAAILAVVLSGGSSLGLELLQRRVPGRRCECGDALAGTLGSVAGVLAASRVRPHANS